MFCVGCGTEMSEDSSFCPNCGTQILGESVKGKSKEYNQVFKFAVEAIKNPVEGYKDLKDILSEKVLLVYFFIGVVLTALITATTIDSIISSIIAKIQEFGNLFSGYSDVSAFLMIRENMLPFGKIFLWILVGMLLFYLLVIASVMLVNVILNKNNVNFTEYFLTASIAITVQLSMALIILLSSFISINLTIFAIGVSCLIVSFILYRGYSQLIGNDNIFVFIFSVILTLIFAISSYIVFKMAYSSILNSSLDLYFQEQNLFY